MRRSSQPQSPRQAVPHNAGTMPAPGVSFVPQKWSDFTAEQRAPPACRPASQFRADRPRNLRAHRRPAQVRPPQLAVPLSLLGGTEHSGLSKPGGPGCNLGSNTATRHIAGFGHPERSVDSSRVLGSRKPTNTGIAPKALNPVLQKRKCAFRCPCMARINPRLKAHPLHQPGGNAPGTRAPKPIAP